MSVRTRKKRAHRKKRQPLSKAMLALVIVLVIFGAGGIAVAAAAAVWLQDLPDYKDSSAFNYAQKTSVYANDGTTLLAEFYVENRDPIELSEMSDYVLEGTVATEDERFYDMMVWYVGDRPRNRGEPYGHWQGRRFDHHAAVRTQYGACR